MSKAGREGRASGRNSVSLAMSSGLVLSSQSPGPLLSFSGQKGIANLSQE